MLLGRICAAAGWRLSGGWLTPPLRPSSFIALADLFLHEAFRPVINTLEALPALFRLGNGGRESGAALIRVRRGRRVGSVHEDAGALRAAFRVPVCVKVLLPNVGPADLRNTVSVGHWLGPRGLVNVHDTWRRRFVHRPWGGCDPPRMASRDHR